MWGRERQRHWLRNNQNYLEHSNLCRGRAVIWKNAASHETAFTAFTVLIQAVIQAIMWVRRKSSKRKVLLSFVVILYNFLKVHFYLKCVSINIRPGRLVQKKELCLRKAENKKKMKVSPWRHTIQTETLFCFQQMSLRYFELCLYSWRINILQNTLLRLVSYKHDEYKI